MTNTQDLITPPLTLPQKRIIKISTCPSLSNNSTLTYHIGCDDNKDIHFRIHSNTGGGFFNNEWIPLLDIQQAFDKWPVDDPITSFALNGLFRGKSANSPAFMMAILKEEGIIVTLKGKSRAHEYVEPTEFLDAMNKLAADGIDLKVETTTDVQSKKPVKDNASATKKLHSRSKPPLKST